MAGRAEPGLKEIPAGSRILIDANIFIYHFTGLSQECTELLLRCEKGEVVGATGLHLLLEVLHRLMMLEAVAEGLVAPGNVARKLKERPDLVKKLHRYEEGVEVILGIGIEVFPLDLELIERSRTYRKEYGLLVNDSLTLALIEEEDFDGLATGDSDLLELRGVVPFVLYAPKDLSSTL